jgi:mycothiol synthase
MPPVEDVRHLTTRRLTYVDDAVDPSDRDLAVRLVLEHEAAVMSPPDTTADDVEDMLAVPSVDRRSSCFLLDGGEPVGLLLVDDDPYETVTGIDVYARPGAGAPTVLRQGLNLGLDAARRRRAELGSTTWKARAGRFLADEVYGAAMAELGMTPVRRFYRMGIDSSSPEIPDVAPALPPGMAVVAAGGTDELRRVVHQVDRDSFSEHWGWADYPYDDWWAHWKVRDSFDPDDWWLLTVDGRPAAICLLGENRAALNEGYVNILGVLKEYRGRGIAQLLLRRAFVHYRDLGRSATLLGVDATNTTGAVALYEKVGMSPRFVMEASEHPLD